MLAYIQNKFSVAYAQVRAYPRTMIPVILLSGLAVASLMGMFYAWPSIALVQYAIGLKTSLETAELGILAAQYGSAFSFWAPLAAAATSLTVATTLLANHIYAQIRGAIAGSYYAKLRNPTLYSETTRRVAASRIVDMSLISTKFAQKALELAVADGFNQDIRNFLTSSREYQAQFEQLFQNSSADLIVAAIDTRARSLSRELTAAFLCTRVVEGRPEFQNVRQPLYQDLYERYSQIAPDSLYRTVRDVIQQAYDRYDRTRINANPDFTISPTVLSKFNTANSAASTTRATAQPIDSHTASSSQSLFAKPV